MPVSGTYGRGCVRRSGRPLDFSRLSDDHGSRLRFTGAMAGIHARDLVDAVVHGRFHGFPAGLRTRLSALFEVSKVLPGENP